jgi:hypothetical protein
MSLFKTELEKGRSIFDIYEEMAINAGVIRRRGSLRDNPKKAAAWYERTIATTLKYQADRTAVNSVIQDNTRKANRIRIGELYMLYYPSPLTSSSLEFYDRFPLVLCTNYTQKHIEGINLHYFPPNMRTKIFMRLIQNRTSSDLAENTRVILSMDRLMKDQNLETALIGYRKYLVNRIRSRVIHIDAPDWLTALYLPFEAFRKAGPRQVWAETRREEANI